MRNYIAADLARISKRVPRIVMMLISFAVFCAATAIYVSIVNLFADPSLADTMLAMETNENTVYDALVQIAGYAVGLFGLFELIYVFSDDIKAKTTQIAIGAGISRTQVVLSKYLELLFLLIADMIVLLALSMVMSMVLGSALSIAQLFGLAKVLASGMLLGNMAYFSLVFVILFTVQSMTGAILGFLALNFHVVSGVINLTDFLPAFQGLQLSRFTLTTMLTDVNAMAHGAQAEFVPFLGCAAYIAAALLIACFLFKKKELEF